MSTGNRLVRLIATLVTAALPEPLGQKPAGEMVFRVAQAGAVKDPWTRRIIELADGRSIEEIAEAMYLELLRSGAGEADVGFWGSLVYRDVAKTIGELARQGYVRIETTGMAVLGSKGGGAGLFGEAASQVPGSVNTHTMTKVPPAPP